jgi:glycosyltransferase involved in cell wall biosynthesis
MTEHTAPHHEPERLKILVSAYACAPGRGSEHGNAWYTILELSKYHDIWVIVTAEYRQPIEDYIASHPLSHVSWHFIDLPKWLIFWRKPLQFERVHYYFWQHYVAGFAQRLHQQIRFDASMHLTFGSYWRPSFLRLLPIPFVWGPIGGAENIPTDFYPFLDTETVQWDRAKRRIERIACQFDPTVRDTARRSSIALAATPHTADQVRRLGAATVRFYGQYALPVSDIDFLGTLPVRQNPSPVRFMSMGRLVGWKGIQLGICAFARLIAQYPDAEYWHDGGGDQSDDIRRLAKELRVDDRFFLFENNTRRQAFENLAQCDVLLFPNLHNESGWVCAEAMAARRPIVYLLGRLPFPDAEKSSFATTAESLPHATEEMAQAMYRLATDNALRMRMGEAARQHVLEHYNIEVRGSYYAQLFRQLASGKHP